MTLKKPLVFETTFSSFTATSVIGEGGAGTVYEAHDESGAKFAIKKLDPSKTSRDKIKRFKNEVTFGERNTHKNIITILDHGTFSDGKKSTPFYVMPFCSGSLRSLLNTQVPPNKILPYFSQLLDGAEAAHLLKIIHRDLKPENVLYDSAEDKLSIADFGIAHFEEEEIYTLVETSPNSRLANFQYAAPEQRSRGQLVDHRADIYALGLILNEMFTGEIPHGTGYKTIGSVAPEYSYLDDLVSEMLRQTASERPASIEAIKYQLIGRENQFITHQRITQLKQTVVSADDLDDPLITDPPRLVNADWERGSLTLFFQQSVNDMWIWALQNLGSHSAIWGKGPENFSISGDKARISCRDDEVQQVIDHFKEWLPLANSTYENKMRVAKREGEEKRRQQIQREIEEKEKRQRVLQSIKI